MSEITLESLAAEVNALRDRVRALEDKEAIHRLTREYMQAMHDARWEDAVPASQTTLHMTTASSVNSVQRKILGSSTLSSCRGSRRLEAGPSTCSRIQQ